MATKPFLSQIAVPVGTTTGEVYYTQTSLLMHFNGTNGSTTMTDNSKNNYSFTATNGAAISTAQNKFGGSSMFFDGTNDYVINNNANSTWAFLHNNTTFTLELWFYTSVTTAQTLIGTNAASATIGFALALSNVNSRDIEFSILRGVGGSILSAISLGSVWTTNTWNHLAVVLNTSTQTVKIYLNGTEVATTSTSGFSFSSSDPSYALAIGRYQHGTPGEYYSGYIDELRITKGVARYTSNFTTSSVAFANNDSVTQYVTKYIGSIGGLNDSNVDYGVEKLSDGSLKIRKMSVSGQPLSGSGALSASVDRVYVNVLNYKEVQTTAQSASYAVSASYLINAASGESFHPFLLG